MQSDLHESYYIYFYNYLLRNLRDIVDLLSHYEGTRCISSNKLTIRYVLHCFADCHYGKKGIKNENVVFI